MWRRASCWVNCFVTVSAEKVFTRKSFRPKKSFDRNVFRSKIYSIEKVVGQIFVRPKCFPTENFFGQNCFWSKNLFGRKIYDRKKIRPKILPSVSPKAEALGGWSGGSESPPPVRPNVGCRVSNFPSDHYALFNSFLTAKR